MNAVLRPGAEAAPPAGLASPEAQLELAQMEREIAIMQRLLQVRALHAELRARFIAEGLSYEAVVREAKTMPDVARVIAAHFGLTLEDLRGSDTRRHVVRPRWVVMAALDARTFEDGRKRYSRSHIGRFLGDRDHTTILYGLRQFWALVDVELAGAGWRPAP